MGACRPEQRSTTKSICILLRSSPRSSLLNYSYPQSTSSRGKSLASHEFEDSVSSAEENYVLLRYHNDQSQRLLSMEDFPFSSSGYDSPTYAAFDPQHADFQQLNTAALQQFLSQNPQYCHLSDDPYGSTLYLNDPLGAQTPISAFSRSSVSQPSPASLTDWTDGDLNSFSWPHNNSNRTSSSQTVRPQAQALFPNELNHHRFTSPRSSPSFPDGPRPRPVERNNSTSTQPTTQPSARHTPRHSITTVSTNDSSASSYRELRPMTSIQSQSQSLSHQSSIDNTADLSPLSPTSTYDDTACEVTAADLTKSTSKRERRRAQNRQAQRKFRVRQQQALDEAVAKLKEIEKQLRASKTDREKYRGLYEEWRGKYVRLLGEREREGADGD